MTNLLPIRYREFWDVPRVFVVRVGPETFLFDCPFDDEAEDFGTSYRVYRMPELAPDDLAGSWVGLHNRALAFLGEVPISSVKFDPSRRESIDPSILDELSATAG